MALQEKPRLTKVANEIWSVAIGDVIDDDVCAISKS